MLLYPTVSKMFSPIDPATGQGAKYNIAVQGNWRLGDYTTLVMTETTTAVQVVVGYGDITGRIGSFAYTYKNKMYVLCGSRFYCSDVGSPTVFNDPTIMTDGYVETQNFNSQSEDLVAMTSYQGRLAFFSRRTTQVWSVSANLSDYSQVQLLQNVGTMAKHSVQSVGDLDVFFLSDSGVRSLRVRDSSLNAYVIDIGSPIDLDIQNALLTAAGGMQNEDACGVVEPTSNRYWLFLKGIIYVLSYFPSSKIIGWTTFTPFYEVNSVPTSFQPLMFTTYGSQVFCRTLTNKLVAFGGTNNNTYDHVSAIAETPWMAAKTPGTNKRGRAVDVAGSGPWIIQAGMDPVGGALDQTSALGSTTSPNVSVDSTFDKWAFPMQAIGSHFKLRAVSSPTCAKKCVLSGLLFHYDELKEK